LTNNSGDNTTIFNKTVTKSGIRIISETIKYIKSVSIGVWVDVGSRDEEEDTNGLAHFIEHMVFKGTEKRSSKNIAQSLESVGGYLNAFTSKEHTCFYVRILDEYTEKAIDVLSDLVVNPVFDPKEIEKEKLVILEELKNYEDEPDELIHDAFESALFSPHPLGFPILGTHDTINSFNRKSVLKFKDTHYNGSRIIVAAAGNIDHKYLVELVEKYFEKMTAKKDKYNRKFAKPKPKGTRQIATKPIHQAHTCLGTYTYNVHDEKRYPLLILNTLLGDGMSSRLYQNIRERYGLAYSIYSFANLMTDIGFFGIYIGTDKDKVKTSIDLIYKELEKIKAKQMSKPELKRIISQVKGGMVLSMENMSNRMMRIGKGELYYGDYFSIDSIIEKVNQVRGEEVLEVAKELLNLDRFSEITFIPENNK
jgi:predicted Zn-dependent peptidase